MSEAGVTELLDRLAISDALARYSRGVDRIDIALIESVFHPKAVLDYGPMFQGSPTEFAAYIAASHAGLIEHLHHLTTLTVAVVGQRAGSECYVLARLRARDDAGELWDFVSQGRYLDEWEKRGGTWSVVRRRFVHCIDSRYPVGESMFPPDGDRAASDPSYAVLGL